VERSAVQRSLRGNDSFEHATVANPTHVRL
jgi:hypothetical protein